MAVFHEDGKIDSGNYVVYPRSNGMRASPGQKALLEEWDSAESGVSGCNIGGPHIWRDRVLLTRLGSRSLVA